MHSFNQEELFEHYYQKQYDYNTESLTSDEISDIKQLANEKRVNYALSPMGADIFDWILGQDDRIRFELIPFEAESIDGMLYIPNSGEENAYIILNSNKALVNQIFTAAHEFYHYIKDYQSIKNKPYICDFYSLKNIKEKRACRFAAELLLPEESLRQEIRYYLRINGFSDPAQMNFEDFAALSMILTVKYELPLKAVIFRLTEEHYIQNLTDYLENYSFIKKVLQTIEIFRPRVDKLYSTRNDYVVQRSIYDDMYKAYSAGYASEEQIIEDAKYLELDLKIVETFFDQGQELLISDNAKESDEEDDILFALINGKDTGK